MSLDIGQVGQSIGPRFHLISAIPAATLVGSVWILASTGAVSGTPKFSAARDSLATLTLSQAAFFVSLSIVVGLLSHPFHTRMVQLLEGYWPSQGPWAVAAEKSRLRHLNLKKVAHNISLSGVTTTHASSRILSRFRSRPSTLDARQRVAASVVYESYPRDDHVMPTSLGNALRAAEDVAGPSFGLATAHVLPFLYLTATNDFVAAIEDAKAALDVSVKLTWVWLSVTPIAIMLFANDGPWLLVPLSTFGLAWIAYRGAVQAAGVYGRLMVRGFVLYRFSLYEAVRLTPPSPADDERSAARDLSKALGVPAPADAAGRLP